MKFARYGAIGHERPALVDQEGRLRDASALLSEVTVETVASLGTVDVASLPLVEGSPRLGVPFTGTRKFIAIGTNFADHAIEANLPIPTEPIVFMKAVSCLAGPNDDVPYPDGATKMDWEVELGIVIGKTARYVSEAASLDHIAGYVLVNDVSERFDQFDRGGSWDKGKGHDGFGPVGPWLVTAEELGEGNNLDMYLDVNGVRRQTGNTRTMIFGVRSIVAYVSRFMTLEPGDIIATGTPPGVGMGFKPDPIYLKIGDVMELGVEKLGTQRQTVVARTVS
jgi:2,4-didehydro-3-deoxy-L-rhamnonate hydrolase